MDNSFDRRWFQPLENSADFLFFFAVALKEVLESVPRRLGIGLGVGRDPPSSCRAALFRIAH